ncbi:MAG: hypothetical protein KF817_01320 [Phycisphaeraceae bacterium]|nr:hypothetical protein [Phycisphaeraceae bacterium]
MPAFRTLAAALSTTVPPGAPPVAAPSNALVLAGLLLAALAVLLILAVAGLGRARRLARWDTGSPRDRPVDGDPALRSMWGPPSRAAPPGTDRRSHPERAIDPWALAGRRMQAPPPDRPPRDEA